MPSLETAHLAIGIVSGLVGSFAGIAAGSRVVYWALERKLDDRYLKVRTRPEDQFVNYGTFNGWGDRVKNIEESNRAHDSRLNNVEKDGALLIRELQHITTHINERVLTALETVTSELKEMRQEQYTYAQVQERHTMTMAEHSRALQAFQSWVCEMSASKVPMFPPIRELD